MKLKIRSDGAGVLEEHGWSQMGDWLAELRDDNRSAPPGDGHPEADPATDLWPEAVVQADTLAEARAGHLGRKVAGDESDV